MEEKKITKIVINPTRQRIMQYILFHKKACTSEIAKELDDIPQATLYRNIKMLLENDFIEVVEEKNVRGVIEKYYSAVNNSPSDNLPSNEEFSNVIQNLLYETGRSFKNFLSVDTNDPIKEMLGYWCSTYVLSDEEFKNLLDEMGLVMQKYTGREMTKDRKLRNLHIMSLPNKGEKK